MKRRTTIEIDDELLTRARRLLGAGTTRATVELALRRAADTAEEAHRERAERQRRYLERLARHVDAGVLESDEMWR